MHLRIVISQGIRDNYDTDFSYMDDSHNVTIPTHSLPGVTWPENALPTDVLEYSGGRIRSIDTTSHSDEVVIYIDRTTREAHINYVTSLLQAGWIDKYEDEFEDFKQGKEQTHGAYLYKGDYNLTVVYYGDGTGKIAYY